MRKNLKKEFIENYYKNIKYKKVKPIFLWCQCDKCKDELLREEIYRVTVPDLILFGRSNEFFGCKQCFNDIQDFKEYCEEKRIVYKPDEVEKAFEVFKYIWY